MCLASVGGAHSKYMSLCARATSTSTTANSQYFHPSHVLSLSAPSKLVGPKPQTSQDLLGVWHGMYSIYLDMHAKEAGHTDSDDEVSEDDRSASDLSFVTSGDDADVDDDMMAIYAQSLSSQASAHGFGTPLFKKRSKDNGDGRGSIFDSIVAKQDRKSKRRLQTGSRNSDTNSTDSYVPDPSRATDPPVTSCLLLPGNATCRDGRMPGRLKLRRSCSLLPGNATCSDKSQSAPATDSPTTLVNACSLLPGNATCSDKSQSAPATSLPTPLVKECSLLPGNDATCSDKSQSAPATVLPTTLVIPRLHPLIIISSDSECEQPLPSHSDAYTQTWLN
jgi:hypothetical protein